jgi:hypothetical protein
MNYEERASTKFGSILADASRKNSLLYEKELDTLIFEA